MNPDLAMGDDLLKKTGAGNLFMVFGEPDVEIRRTRTAWSVEIRGVDVYDPTTGQVRSSTTDDIACWFIDTNYNEESFFVRDAYFTGAGDPYESAPQGAARRHRRSGLGNPLPHREPPLPAARDGQDRREGDQPLRRRGDEGLRGRELKMAAASDNNRQAG